jgi:hypothetical protein
MGSTIFFFAFAAEKFIGVDNIRPCCINIIYNVVSLLRSKPAIFAIITIDVFILLRIDDRGR